MKICFIFFKITFIYLKQHNFYSLTHAPLVGCMLFRIRFIFEAPLGRLLICLHVKLVYPHLITINYAFYKDRVHYSLQKLCLLKPSFYVALHKIQIFWDEPGPITSHTRNFHHSALSNAKFTKQSLLGLFLTFSSVFYVDGRLGERQIIHHCTPTFKVFIPLVYRNF